MTPSGTYVHVLVVARAPKSSSQRVELLPLRYVVRSERESERELDPLSVREADRKRNEANERPLTRRPSVRILGRDSLRTKERTEAAEVEGGESARLTLQRKRSLALSFFLVDVARSEPTYTDQKKESYDEAKEKGGKS